ncbi:unnamed protein product [Somion occarium]|uniref:BTB domain-containing protein n=1 Tax=Somion occarium TaxID=3059160 RepID=A0ABP1ECX0_9APHY
METLFWLLKGWHSGCTVGFCPGTQRCFETCFPQPDEIDEVDGCKMVELSDENKDIAILLSALYEGSSIFGDHNVLPFPTVEALIRLGMKYQVEVASQEGIRRLERLYSLDDHEMEYSIEGKKSPHFTPSVTMVPEDSVHVLTLAKTFDIDALLFGAMYACCQLDIDTCLDAVSSGKWDMEDLRRCLKTKEVLLCMQSLFLEHFYGLKVSKGCPTKSGCRANLQAVLQRRMKQHDIRFRVGSHPLSLKGRLLPMALKEDLCDLCVSKLKSLLAECDACVWRFLKGIP